MTWRSGVPWLAISLVVLLVAPLYAQEGMPGSATTPAEQDGRRVFIQRCAVCHLPLLPSPKQSYGPMLDGLLQRSSEERVRQAILVGYGRMPGWQYTLTVEQVSNVIAYLKTFAK